MDSSHKRNIRILLSVRSEERRKEIMQCLQSVYAEQLQMIEIELIQDSIEHLEEGNVGYDLIIFEQTSRNRSLVNLLMELGKKSAFVMVIPMKIDPSVFASLPVQPEFLVNHEIEELLPNILNKFAGQGRLPPLPTVEEGDYFSVDPDSIAALNPVTSDVYVKLGEGRFICLFKSGTVVQADDIKRYEERFRESEEGKNPKNLLRFYFKRKDAEISIQNLAKNLETLAAKPEVSREEAATQFSNSFGVIGDLVTQVGFTPQAQSIAKSCVSMTLKAIGAKPRLARILTELKKKEGNYIVSHSFMVGEVACALAQKLEWNSPTTFFKLTLAAFLHDITLHQPELARVTSIADAKATGRFTTAEIQAVNIHPMRAAEYSRQFHEIPSDVDQILAQHHERPDGTGFPREMSGKLISPLSALFIMAHDLVDYFLDHPGTSYESFFEMNAAHYQSGQFKKILVGMKTPD